MAGSSTFLGVAPGQFSSVSSFAVNTTSNITTATLSLDATTLLQTRFQMVFRNCFGNSSVYGTWTACSDTLGLALPAFASPWNQGSEIIVPVPGPVVLTVLGTSSANITNSSSWRVTYPNNTVADARLPLFDPTITLQAPWNFTISFVATSTLHNVLLTARALNCASTTSGVSSRNFRLCNVNESSAPFFVAGPEAVISPLESLSSITINITASTVAPNATSSVEWQYRLSPSSSWIAIPANHTRVFNAT